MPPTLSSSHPLLAPDEGRRAWAAGSRWGRVWGQACRLATAAQWPQTRSPSARTQAGPDVHSPGTAQREGPALPDLWAASMPWAHTLSLRLPPTRCPPRARSLQPQRPAFPEPGTNKGPPGPGLGRTGPCLSLCWPARLLFASVSSENVGLPRAAARPPHLSPSTPARAAPGSSSGRSSPSYWAALDGVWSLILPGNDDGGALLTATGPPAQRAPRRPQRRPPHAAPNPVLPGASGWGSGAGGRPWVSPFPAPRMKGFLQLH